MYFQLLHIQTGFWCGKLREGEDLEDPSVEARIILKWIFKKWNGGTDRIDLAQNKGSWRVLVNAVIDLRVP